MQYKKYILYLLLSSIYFTAHAQQPGMPSTGPISKDSITARETRYWANNFKLSKKQTAELLQANQRMQQRTDSVMRLPLKGKEQEKRKEFIKAARKDHNQALKKIFSKKQWEDYTTARKKQREAFKEKMKQSNRKLTMDADDEDN